MDSASSAQGDETLASRACPPPPPWESRHPQNKDRNHNTLHMEGQDVQAPLEADLRSPSEARGFGIEVQGMMVVTKQPEPI